MERAFKFLKSTSVSCGVAEDGGEAAAEDKGGVVLSGDVLGEPTLSGEALGEAFDSAR
jgi:hypothetical protein